MVLVYVVRIVRVHDLGLEVGHKLLERRPQQKALTASASSLMVGALDD